jgi:hypothetical protein
MPLLAAASRGEAIISHIKIFFCGFVRFRHFGGPYINREAIWGVGTSSAKFTELQHIEQLPLGREHSMPLIARRPIVTSVGPHPKAETARPERQVLRRGCRILSGARKGFPSSAATKILMAPGTCGLLVARGAVSYSAGSSRRGFCASAYRSNQRIVSVRLLNRCLNRKSSTCLIKSGSIGTATSWVARLSVRAMFLHGRLNHINQIYSIRI